MPVLGVCIDFSNEKYEFHLNPKSGVVSPSFSDKFLINIWNGNELDYHA